MKTANSRTKRDGRYEVKQNVLLFNQTSFAEIVDIDENGATCRAFTDFRAIETPQMFIELLNCDAGMHMKGISCRLVSNDKDVQSALQGFGGTCTLEFPDLSQQQREELEKFIRKSCYDSQSIN